MARPAVIFYKKVTLSLPRKVVDILAKIENRKRSQYVAEAIYEKEEKEREEIDVDSFFQEFHRKYKPKPGPSSLEILRKFRYEIN